VCFFAFAFVYVQYFGLFTIFGGTTPGMMVRGLQVVSFSGENPTAKHGEAILPARAGLHAIGWYSISRISLGHLGRRRSHLA